MTFLGHFLFGLVFVAVLVAYLSSTKQLEEVVDKLKSTAVYKKFQPQLEKNDVVTMVGVYLLAALVWPVFVVYYGYTRYKKTKQ